MITEEGKGDRCGGPQSSGVRIGKRQRDHCGRRHPHKVRMDTVQRDHYVGLTSLRAKLCPTANGTAVPASMLRQPSYPSLKSLGLIASWLGIFLSKDCNR